MDEAGRFQASIGLTKASEFLLATLREGILIADSKRVVRFGNAAAGTILKTSVDALPGARIDAVLGLRAAPGTDPIDELCSGTPSESRVIETVRSDGSSRVFSLSARRLTQSSEPWLAVSFQDITDQVRLREAATQRFSFFGLTTRDARMLEVFRLIDQTADSPAPVLISGEPGTGKETVARAIHLRGPRATHPFSALACKGMPADLLEVELFGGGKSAALGERQGRVDLAGSGIVYLEEVSELPPLLQQKTLQLLRDQSYSRMGETRARRSEARIIASTSLDLRRLVAEGHFREDLLFRLRVIPIHLPPLRERREDIPLLVQHFLERSKRRYGKDISGISEKALAELMGYPWPGNVTELEHAVEYAFVRCGSDTLERKDLPPEILAGPAAKPSRPVNLLRGLDPEKQKKVIEQALQESKGNRMKAAALLGITRVTLWKKIKQWGLGETVAKSIDK
ncbi:MAG: sigma 54-interacting transcriptional regulator [Nitrospirae bacterium]|nr:sigma 54-interacting transcriptional regulator [Nitrospirota bacterium]